MDAGKRLLRERGGDMPVEDFCAAANVTRATFYRHFPDRFGLYRAVLDEELVDVEAKAALSESGPLEFLRLFAETTMIYDRFMASLPDLPPDYGIEEQEAKITAALALPLARAKAAGAIRADVSCEDIMVACRMIGCGWRLDRRGSRSLTLERRIALMLTGLGA